MSAPMVEFKSVILMPTLHLVDLFDIKKVKDFVHKMRAWVVNNPDTWMHEGVSGDCWEVLHSWNDSIVESRKNEDDDEDETVGYFPSDDILSAALLDLFNLGEGEGARANFKKLKMKPCKEGNISLPDIMAHQIVWYNQLRNTPSEHLPARSELIKIFLDSITHDDLRQRLYNEYNAEKESMQVQKKSSVEPKKKSIKDYLNTFVSIAKEMAQVLARATIIRSTNSSASSSNDELTRMVSNAVKRVLNTQVNEMSHSARRKATKKAKGALNTVTAPKFTQKEMRCYGCNNKGHGRNNCPLKDHKDFVKHPNHATKTIPM